MSHGKRLEWLQIKERREKTRALRLQLKNHWEVCIIHQYKAEHFNRNQISSENWRVTLRQPSPQLVSETLAPYQFRSRLHWPAAEKPVCQSSLRPLPHPFPGPHSRSILSIRGTGHVTITTRRHSKMRWVSVLVLAEEEEEEGVPKHNTLHLSITSSL